MCGKQTERSDCSGLTARPCRCILFGLVAFFAFMLSSASWVSASCGDYLHHHRDFPTHDLQTHPAAPVDSISHELNSDAEHPSDPATPCRGPHCRSNPTPLAPTSPPSLLTWDSETAALLETNSVTVAEWSTPIFPISVRELGSGGLSIFRPPRA